jgi:uncharacterized membrane protein
MRFYALLVRRNRVEVVYFALPRYLMLYCNFYERLVDVVRNCMAQSVRTDDGAFIIGMGRGVIFSIMGTPSPLSNGYRR